MNELKIKMSGKYAASLIDSVTGEVKFSGEWFDNIITNPGLERMGNGTFLSRCHIGSGTATPTVDDTGLQNPLAEVAWQTPTFGPGPANGFFEANGAAETAPYYGWRRRTFRFGAGVGTGTISEVGIFWAPGNSAAYSRALITQGGLPTPIVKLATDILDITYELRNYAPVNDISFSTVIAGNTHMCIARAANVTSSAAWNPMQSFDGAVGLEGSYSATAYSGDIRTVTQVPEGSAQAVTGNSNFAYVTNSKQRRIQLDWGVDEANFPGGIRSIVSNTTIGSFQCQFDPPIDKVGPPTRSLRLIPFVSWGRKTL